MATAAKTKANVKQRSEVELDLLDFIEEMLNAFDESLIEPYSNVKVAHNGKWRVVSSLQKAVRRGDRDYALKSACALARSEEDYLWHRMGIIAIEEMALDNAKLIAAALFLTRNKRQRSKYDPVLLAAAFAEQFAIRDHDRILCHMNCMILNPRYDEIRRQLVECDDDYLIDLATDGSSDIGNRILAWKGLAGGLVNDVFGPKDKQKYRKHDPVVFEELIDEMDYDPITRYIIMRGKSLGVEGFFTNMPLAIEIYKHEADERGFVTLSEDELPNHIPIKGLLSPAFDMHTLEGKRALAYFNKAAGFHDWCKERGFNPVEILGLGVFLVEGGELLQNRVTHPTGEYLLDEMFNQVRDRFGFKKKAWRKFLNEVRAKLPEMHKSRERIVIGK